MRFVVVLLLASVAFGQTDAAFAHAVELHKAGDLEGAMREYKAVLEAEPTRLDARSNLGAILAKLGRYQEAIEQYQQAIKVAPEELAPLLRLNLALAYYKSVQMQQAKAELTRLHTEQPDNLNVTLLLADCYLRTGEYKQVIEVLTPVEPTQPDNRAITYMLGLALIQDGQIPQGQQRVDKILRDGDSAEARFLMAMGMFMAKDYPAAVKGFARAIELKPNIPSLQSNYGQALLRTGDAEGAAAAFRKELAANPSDFDANLGLGQILAERRQTADALPYLQRAVQLRPGSQEAQAAVASLRAGKSGTATTAASGGLAVGTAAPDFDLLDLKKYRGHQPVVLVFGSYTCPQFRGDAGALNTLYEKYKDRIAFKLVYIKEAHSGADWQSSINEREGVALPPARDLTEKKEHASLCVRKLNIRFPAVTDGMDGKMEAAYDAWPSRVYLLGPDGRVAFNSRLGEQDFHAPDLDAAMAKSLAH